MLGWAQVPERGVGLMFVVEPPEQRQFRLRVRQVVEDLHVQELCPQARDDALGVAPLLSPSVVMVQPCGTNRISAIGLYEFKSRDLSIGGDWWTRLEPVEEISGSTIAGELWHLM